MFLQHLPTILPLHTFGGDPPFHDLWFKLLETLQPFLALEQPPQQAAAAEAAAEAQAAAAVPKDPARMAQEYLKTILVAMTAHGLFQPGDRTVGRELWQFTWTVLEGFGKTEGLCATLFPGSDFDRPPTAAAARWEVLLPPAVAQMALGTEQQQVQRSASTAEAAGGAEGQASGR